MVDIWDDEFDADTESELVKQLRAVIKAGKAKNDEQAAELKALRPAVRKQTVAEILKGLNVTNPKIAGLVPSDIDTTPEAIKAWVDEYGDIFGASATSTTSTDPAPTEEPVDQDENDGLDENIRAQWQRVQSIDSQAGVTTPDKESEQIAMLQAADKASGGDSELFFAMLKGEVPIPS
jgi:hypothetical protein